MQRSLDPFRGRLIREELDQACISDLPFAANRLYREALQLREGGYYHGAIYLAGYVAEVELGYAYARLLRLPEDAPAHSGVHRPARSAAIRLLGEEFVSEFFRQGHSPLFWWSLIRETRRVANRPLAQSTLGRIDSLASFVDASWDVSIRYLPALATEQESLDVLRAVSTLRGESWRLWR